MNMNWKMAVRVAQWELDPKIFVQMSGARSFPHGLFEPVSARAV
jgi:hypothetical protein